VRGGDQAEVVDPGGVRVRPGCLRDGAVHVPAGDERGRGPGGLAVQEHLDDRQVLGVLWSAARYAESWWSGVTELGILPYLGCIIAPDQRAVRNAIKASGGL
jgi:hypothetical protein